MHIPTRLVCALVASQVASGIAVFAAPANSTPTNGSVVTPSPRSQAESAAITAALSNNAGLVESSLAQGLASAAKPDVPGSAPWHVGMGLALMEIVHQTPQEGSGRTTILGDLVQRAETHFQQADAAATTPAQHASAQALLGLLNERFIGNMSAAISYYRSAVALDPAHTQAKLAADRLEQSESRLQQRVAAKGQAQ